MPPTDGLPELRPVLRTAEAGTILGFDVPGEEAIAWWRSLRDNFPRTGLWPLLIDDGVQDRAGTELQTYEEIPDGLSILKQRSAKKLEMYGKALASRIQAQLRGEGVWPSEAVRPGFRLPSRKKTVTVALVPAEASWRVPLVLGLRAWNDYPDPIEHAAILRYWNAAYGAEPVVMTAETVELSLTNPAATRLQALGLAWEYELYNDGSYDYYLADDLTELAAGLLLNDVVLAWWD